MKSSLHSLIPFLFFFFITFDCHLQNLTQFLTTTNSNDFLCAFIPPRHGPHRKHNLYIVEKTCVLIRCLALSVLLLRVRFRGNVVTESLPSNGSIRHNILWTWEQNLFTVQMVNKVLLTLEQTNVRSKNVTSYFFPLFYWKCFIPTLIRHMLHFMYSSIL
jgi:hypothetical protein